MVRIQTAPPPSQNDEIWILCDERRRLSGKLEHCTRNYLVSREPEDKEVSLCRICAHMAAFSFGGLHLVGIDRKEALQLVVRNL